MSKNEPIKPASNAAEVTEVAREALEAAQKTVAADEGKPEPAEDASESAHAKRGRPRKGKKAAAAVAYPEARSQAEGAERITLEQQEELRQIIEENRSMGKVDAKQAFRRSDLLNRAREFVPDKMWKGFCEVDMCFTDGQARNYLRLQEIPDLRERCIAGAVTTSILYELPRLPEEQREEIVSVFENGGRVPVAKVKAALRALKNGGEAETEAAPEDRGGPAGLLGLASAKAKVGTKNFVEGVKSMIVHINDGLEPHWRGKRVAKAALADQIEHTARRTRADLQNVGLYLTTMSTSDPWRTFPADFPEDTGWHRVLWTLHKLGGREDWPAAGDVGDWLVNEVLPTLNWAAGTKPKAGKEEPESGEAKPKRARKARKQAKEEAPKLAEV